MSWKQAAGLLTVVFVLAVLQAALAGPLITLQDGLLDSGDYSNEHWDGESLIEGMFSSWFDMGLVAFFLLMGVAVARAVRRELTRQRGT